MVIHLRAIYESFSSYLPVAESFKSSYTTNGRYSVTVATTTLKGEQVLIVAVETADSGKTLLQITALKIVEK